MTSWLEANPVLIGITVFTVILAILMLIIGGSMRRAGLSLRPIWFFLGFVAVVGGPQAAYHLAHLEKPGSTPPTPSINSDVFTVTEDRFTHPEEVFGSDVDTTLIQPAKPIFPEFLSSAIHAEMAYFVTGETVLAAVFRDPDGASKALDAYARYMQLTHLSGSEATGWIGSRGSASDRAEIVAAGPVFMAWTGANDEILAKRRLAIEGAVGARVDVSAPQAQNEVPFGDMRLAVIFLLVNVAVAVFWFFKGATWAASTPPTPGTSPVSLDELRKRLLAVNQTDTPVTVAVSDDGSTIDVTWRYADARWIDFARAHGTRRVHRISMILDEASRTARVLEYWSAIDWSAGGDAASIQWRAARGINFFTFRHERVFGLQVTPEGTLKPNLSYTYTFDLQELKQPFIQAITRSGWTWKPVFVLAPAWLRWLVG